MMLLRKGFDVGNLERPSALEWSLPGQYVISRSNSSNTSCQRMSWAWRESDFRSHCRDWWSVMTVVWALVIYGRKYCRAPDYAEVIVLGSCVVLLRCGEGAAGASYDVLSFVPHLHHDEPDCI